MVELKKKRRIPAWMPEYLWLQNKASSISDFQCLRRTNLRNAFQCRGTMLFNDWHSSIFDDLGYRFLFLQSCNLSELTESTRRGHRCHSIPIPWNFSFPSNVAKFWSTLSALHWMKEPFYRVADKVVLASRRDCRQSVTSSGVIDKPNLDKCLRSHLEPNV